MEKIPQNFGQKKIFSKNLSNMRENLWKISFSVRLPVTAADGNLAKGCRPASKRSIWGLKCENRSHKCQLGRPQLAYLWTPQLSKAISHQVGDGFFNFRPILMDFLLNRLEIKFEKRNWKNVHRCFARKKVPNMRENLWKMSLSVWATLWNQV